MTKVTAKTGFASLDQERIIILDSGGKEVKAEYISVRLKSTHLTGSRYRGGIRFTSDKAVILDVSKLTPEQIKAINADGYLTVKETTKPDDLSLIENGDFTDNEDGAEGDE